jgi:hypothetical protein
VPAQVVTTSLGRPCLLGLISDTHGGIVNWDDVHPKVAPLFESVDAILHCGDVGNYDVLDALGGIAPVLALRNTEDPPARGPDLVDGNRVIDVGGTRIGLVFSLTGPPVEAVVDPGLSFPKVPAGRVGESLFGHAVDVVVFGGTHEDLIAQAGGTLFVNPGSPSLAVRTTVGLLRIADGIVEARILRVGD